MTNASAVSEIEWIEGLALGCDALYTAWNDNTSVENISAADGSTTSTRANENGSYTGQIVEYAFWIDIPTVSAAITG